MPRPLSGNEEAVIACVKSDMQQIYKDYMASSCDEKGRIKQPNLSKQELRGLRSLLKRIKDREVMVLPPDKSGKLLLLVGYLYPKYDENCGK